MLACLALAVALGQAASAPPAGDIVRVDVIARDAQGRPVETLKPSDFELREDGTPQTLVDARLIRGAPHLIAIYLDEYYVSASSTAAVKIALHRFVDDLGADDQVVILRPLA